ncbi:HTH-type transcriptional activator Btr [Thalassocella blandensis]|nr:HTH-type transcriptional activator Btr [Thalassocella blandensis]
MAAASQIAFKSTVKNLEGCEITWGRFHHFDKHSHEGLMLSVIDAGEQQLEYNSKSYTAKKGNVVAMAPEESHSSSVPAAAGWAFRSLIVPNALVERLTGQYKHYYLCDVSIENSHLSQLLHSFFQAVPEKDTLAMESLLAETLNCFFTHHRADKIPDMSTGRTVVGLAGSVAGGGAGQGAGRGVERAAGRIAGKTLNAVKRARDFLASHPNDNISLVQLSEAAHMDGFHLNRAFKKYYGLPPHAWHRQFRIKHAQSLLAIGGRPVDVAMQCGFADQAHFCRTFKRVTGVSPAHYATLQAASNPFRSLADIAW